MNDKTIAELREWKKQYDIFPSMAADKEFLEILSHAVPVKEVEPLAVLAGRKTYFKAWIKEFSKEYVKDSKICNREFLSNVDLEKLVEAAMLELLRRMK